jgi:Tfp pilus assembly protein PilF
VTLGILVVLAALAAAEAWAQPASTGPLGTPVPAVDEKIQEVADAKARFIKRDFVGALSLLREAVKKNADRLPPGQVIMAMWCAEANLGNAVLGSLEMAVIEEPSDPQAYLILANVELQAGRVTAAGLLFEKAQSLMAAFSKSPTRKKNLEPNVYAGLAAVAESRATLSQDDKTRASQEWVGAEEKLRAWLKLDPSNAIALQRLARALFKQGSLEKQDKEKAKQKVNEAFERLKEAQKAEANVLNPAATMARFYQEEGDFSNAKKFMDYALQTAGKDLRTRLEAARWCLQTSLEDPEQLNQAKEHAAQAIRLDDKSIDAMILRGVVALFQKEYETAERFFQGASLQSPSNFAASNNLALALCEQDETKKRRALELATNNARQHAEDQYAGEAASTYAWVLYKNNRAAEAENVLGRLLMSARVSEDTLYYAAEVAAARGRPQEAAQLLQRALGTKSPFSMRPEALRLQERLKKTAVSP